MLENGHIELSNGLDVQPSEKHHLVSQPGVVEEHPDLLTALLAPHLVEDEPLVRHIALHRPEQITYRCKGKNRAFISPNARTRDDEMWGACDHPLQTTNTRADIDLGNHVIGSVIIVEATHAFTHSLQQLREKVVFPYDNYSHFTHFSPLSVDH